jgi:UDP-glucose 4-epimerase
MSTILVTGGAGYIGSHTVRALANLNYKVSVGQFSLWTQRSDH